MMSNNPVYTMRLIDLIDMYGDSFTYEDLYKVVGEWLSTEKVYFVSDDNELWNRFIESFCDRFYSRNINFDTTLDFKLKLRNVLRKYKRQAERIVEVDMLKINPLSTYSNVVKRTEKTNGNNLSKSKGRQHTAGSNSDDSTDKADSTIISDDTAFNYNLHSDTPANAVNIDDLFSVAKNYVTDADNNKTTSHGNVTNTAGGESHSTSSNISDTDNSAETTSEFSDNHIYDELANGYTGNPSELLIKYMELVSDVVAYYLDWIEDECLFSSVLY